MKTFWSASECWKQTFNWELLKLAKSISKASEIMGHSKPAKNPISPQDSHYTLGRKETWPKTQPFLFTHSQCWIKTVTFNNPILLSDLQEATLWSPRSRQQEDEVSLRHAQVWSQNPESLISISKMESWILYWHVHWTWISESLIQNPALKWSHLIWFNLNPSFYLV